MYYNNTKIKFKQVIIVEKSGNDPFDQFAVYGLSKYPKSSLLAGQPMKVHLDSFPSRDLAIKNYPEAV